MKRLKASFVVYMRWPLIEPLRSTRKMKQKSLPLLIS